MLFRSDGQATESMAIEFKDNPMLMNEFLEAFNEEKANALQVIENGQGIPQMLRFQKAIYMFIYREEIKTVIINVIKGDLSSIHIGRGVSSTPPNALL